MAVSSNDDTGYTKEMNAVYKFYSFKLYLTTINIALMFGTVHLQPFIFHFLENSQR